MAGIVGWVLAHRRVLIVAYLVLLHGLVYFALTHGIFSAKEAPVCSPVRAATPTDLDSHLTYLRQGSRMPASVCPAFVVPTSEYSLSRHHPQRGLVAVH